MTEQAAEVAASLEAVRGACAAAAQAAGREPASVGLIAVSKKQPMERVQAALDAGQRSFGENYVQEAQARWAGLRPGYPDLELHLIGSLQSNKAAEAVALFDVIHTLDRAKLARALRQEMDRQGRAPRLLIQVNTGEEPQKSGVAPGGLEELLALCRDELGLTIAGLMAIPPEDEDTALHAALLAKLARRHGLSEVSIGMSGDFETAIRFGATQVRVGTLIFGSREPRPG